MPDFTEIAQSDLESILSEPKTALLDVREVSEFADFNIGGINIPPHELTERFVELESYETILLLVPFEQATMIVS